MKNHARSFMIAALVALAAVPALAGCVVVPAYHGYWHGGGHYAGHWRR